MKENHDNQTVSEFVHLISCPGLRVCAQTPCYEIRGPRSGRRLVASGQSMSPENTFSVRSLSEVRLGQRQVVVATLSFTHDGDLAKVLASHIINPESY
jgi:hypothetical protein